MGALQRPCGDALPYCLPLYRNLFFLLALHQVLQFRKCVPTSIPIMVVVLKTCASGWRIREGRRGQIRPVNRSVSFSLVAGSQITPVIPGSMAWR